MPTSASEAVPAPRPAANFIHNTPPDIVISLCNNDENNILQNTEQ